MSFANSAAIGYSRTADDDFPAYSRIDASAPLYKYIRREYLHKLLSHGEIRIGTLFEYRQTETYGLVIGDDAEGRESFSTNRPLQDLRTVRFAAKHNVHLTNVVSHGSGDGFRVDVESLDYYIYCVTRSFSEEAMRDFGCDACVLIRNPEEFFGCITQKLHTDCGMLQRHEVRPIVYRPRHTQVNFDMPTGVAPWLVKDDSYAYQHEIRARWSRGSRSNKTLDVLPPLKIEGLKNHVTVYF